MAHDSAPITISVTHEGGVRFAAHVRSHRILVDQPLPGGGTDTAPAPMELLGAALGTCAAYYVHQFCEARGVPESSWHVDVEQHHVRNPNRVGRFIVRVTLTPEFPESYRSILEAVVRSCPAHSTIQTGADVDVNVLREDEKTRGRDDETAGGTWTANE